MEDEKISNTYVYFLYNHEKKRKFKIKFDSSYLVPIKSVESSELNLNLYAIQTTLITKSKNNKQKDWTIKIILEDEERGDFKKIINKINININNFIFDFSFSPRPTFFTEFEPPGQYILPHRLQYMLFRKMLEAYYEKIELINSTKHFFIDDKYTFEFFITFLDDIIIYSRNDINFIVDFCSYFEINKITEERS